MSPQKYLAAAAAIAVMIGAALFLSTHSSQKGSEVASFFSQTPNDSPSSAPKAMTVEAISATPQDLQHMKVLEEVLISKNDNDPRLDSEFRGLSPNSKRLMEERYHSLAPEKRNERGTIAFLVGREISSSEDVAFMGSILSEAPCLSLGDCTREEKDIDDAHMHAATGMNVTLAYPQMVALHSIEGQIERAEKGAKLSYQADIRRVVDEASRSPIPLVADKARSLLERLKNLGS